MIGRLASLAVALTLLVAAGGHTQTAPPRRIVSVVPAVTEMLFAMNAGSRVAGVSRFDHDPPEVERLPKVGGLLDPDVERILSLRPDLVIVYGTQAELRQQLDRASVPCFAYTHAGLPDITRTIREVGERIGARADAERLATRIEHELDAIRAHVASRPRPRTLLVFGRESLALRGIDASGGVGFLHDLLELAGGADVFGDVARESVRASTETIIARAPEVIVELHYGAGLRPDQIPRERQVWSALASVPAVRNGRVHLLIGDEFVIAGPRIVEAARRLAQALHPEVY